MFTALLVSFGQVPVFGPVLGVFIHPVQQELGWSRATISFGFTLGNLLGFAITAVIGSLLDRYGARIMVVATGVVITAAMVGIAVMDRPWQFWIYFGLGRGSAMAGIQVGTSIAIANWFVRKRGRAMAIKGLGLRVGQSVYPLIIVAIIAVSTWRHAFGALAGLSFLCIVLPAALFLRRRPEDFGLHPDGMEPTLTTTAPLNSTQRRREGHEESWPLADARRTGALWLIVAFMTLSLFCMGSINLHMVANFQDKGVPAALAVSVLSIFAATSALTVLPWGFLLERIHVRYGTMLMCGFHLTAMVLILFARTFSLAVVFGLVYGVAMGGWTVIQTLLLADYFGRQHLGSIRGFTAPFRALGPIGPVATGYVRDVTGSYSLAFIVFAGVFLLMFILIILATPPSKGIAAADAAGTESN